ncbi:MAG: cation:proton antiporter [Alcaligenaceae bacterium]|nr:cation:proton antiporter [Alcaligenaceae bacterium]
MSPDLPNWAMLAISLLLVVAGFFAFTGSLGLLRLPHFYSRIHAPTLGNTLAAFCIVVSILIMASVTEHRFVAHSLLVSFFLIITSPVTAMLLMRAAIKRELRRGVAERKKTEEASAGQTES